ncbi:MAG: flagellar hook-associated protein FlgK [Tepidisphaeraceae bacterium]
MSLIGALNLGKQALAIQQAAIQTTGNNIANAGNADYTRQTTSTTPNRDQQLRAGLFVGTGLNLTAIQRQIDESLQTRLRAAVSEDQSGDVTQQWLSRVEAVFNELSNQDLSSHFSEFFNSWSELANKPQDIGLRQVVLQNGKDVAQYLQGLREQLGGLQGDAESRLSALTADANNLAQQIADVNGQIVLTEGGAGPANGLRDQRDALLRRLSELVDIKTVPQDSGVVNVYVGSEPLIIGTDNRGVSVKQESDGQTIHSTVTFKSNNGSMSLSAGQLGALDSVHDTIDGVVESIDELAGAMIFELNKLHSSGQGLEGLASVTSSNSVDDATVALNDPGSGLEFVPANGSFVVHVRSKATGLVTSTLIRVDLDGLNSNDTTLTSLAADLDAAPNVSASINAGKLAIAADSANVEISFSQDSSGALAALGINTFFTGSSARDIAVNQSLLDKPQLLAAARNGENGDNQTALAIAALERAALASLDGTSLMDGYQSVVNGVASSAASARSNAEGAKLVRETLENQREALSGVSLDEEAVNLMQQQRAFQGAARLIASINEMMQELVNLVR